VVVLIPNMSRPYVELHFRIFCTHHGLKHHGCFTMPSNFPTFDKFQAEAIFYLVMLNSPFVTEAKNEFRKSTSLSSFYAPQIDQPPSAYPERQLTVAQAKQLVHKTIRLSSSMFPEWDQPVHFMNAYIVGYDSKKRTFEFAFPDEYDTSDFSHFKAHYKGNPKDFNVVVYYRQKESAIVKFGEPDFVKGLQQEFESASKPRTKCRESRHAETELPVTALRGKCERISTPATEKPSGFRVSSRISVLWSTSWKEGTIDSVDGDTVTVKGDKADEQIYHFDEIKAYKLIAERLVSQQPSQEDEWICVPCSIWHSSLDGPKEKVCCSKCKVPFIRCGILFSQQNQQRRKRKASPLTCN